VGDDMSCGTFAAFLVSRSDSYKEDKIYYISRGLSKMAYQSCDIDIQTYLKLNCIFRNNLVKVSGDTHLISDCPDSGLDDKEMKECKGKMDVYMNKYVRPLMKPRLAQLQEQRSLLSKVGFLDVLEVEYAENCGYENI
jgi:hypothetical protein